tara:strand:- start:25 stop:789 length:765 start_codon:yes stop_codon:yes gene_type:complete
VFYIGVFIIGCIFGSFSNVCIFRLPNNKKISKGRSFCINCKKEINWFDNLPLLSFVILKGKCRYCNNSISFQYFLVELIAGLSFIYIYHFFGFSITSVLLATLIIFFIIIFFIDLKHYIIPNELTFPLMAVGFLKSFLPNLNQTIFPNYINSLIGGIIGYGIIWLIILLYKKIRNKDGMGLGDAKLLAVIGFWFGWISIPFVIFLSSAIALIIVIPDLLKKSKKLSSQIPFGPYIIIATLIFIVFKDDFLNLLL